MALPPGFLDELRARVSIAQVAGRKVSWDNRKSNPARGDYWAPCPFHQEKTASFHVDEAKGFYHCFGCHAGGDVIAFVRETDNLGFMEAIELLAREAGMPMPSADPAAAARAEKARGLVEAMEAAVQFYRLQLNAARATAARDYLDRRGLAAETRARFEIGFAPDSPTALQEHLKAKGFDARTLAEAGLTGRPEGGGAPYDRFRGRIMFPIRDPRGRAIAFGARALPGGRDPKYLNSPETPLFDKSRTLYNHGPARAAAGKAGTVIVAEGYMDVIALAGAGFEHSVAPLGTAITEHQLRLLWRMAPEPVVALDGDEAGLNAAHRLIELALPLLEPGQALRFAILPARQDPDDVIRAGGAQAMQALVDRSQPMVDLIWDRETKGAVLDSPERRRALGARLRTLVNQIRDPALRRHYETEIADRLRRLFTPERPASRRFVRGSGRRPEPGPSQALRASALAHSGAAEARVRECAILAGCLNHPALAAELEEQLERTAFTCPDLAEIRDALLSVVDASLSPEHMCRAVATRTGQDPLALVTQPGQVRANRHLGPRADAADARRAIDEELTRQAAWSGRIAETRDAERELSGATAESVGWRLRIAAEALESAASRPLAEHEDGLEVERQEFATVIDRAERSLNKPPKR